jgi:hypothetical protein
MVTPLCLIRHNRDEWDEALMRLFNIPFLGQGLHRSSRTSFLIAKPLKISSACASRHPRGSRDLEKRGDCSAFTKSAESPPPPCRLAKRGPIRGSNQSATRIRGCTYESSLWSQGDLSRKYPHRRSVLCFASNHARGEVSCGQSPERGGIVG